MNDENKEKEEEIKIIDKRRFTEEGEAREPKEGSAEAAAKDTQESPKGNANEGSEDRSDEVEVEFSGFLMSLATQALIQLGEMEPPEGINIKKDVSAAKQTIDIIEMLEIKTRGNLSEAEKRLIDDILHNLRITYVKHA